MIDTTFRKVTVFVTRGAAPCREILTFIHPFGGRQLPAGSVEKGEAPIESAKREVWEETHLRDDGASGRKRHAHSPAADYPDDRRFSAGASQR